MTTDDRFQGGDDPAAPRLCFDDVTPVAPHGLGGMTRDLFGNGRLFATLGAHGGLLQVSHWGNQHLGASSFFRADPGTAWIKLFRMYATVDGRRYYLTLNETRLYPFGYRSRCGVGGVAFEHDLMLLPDALVQRVRIARNPRRLPVRIEMMHHEACTAVNIANREWSDFTFEKRRSALVASCRDRNPTVFRGGDSLAQFRLRDIGFAMHEAPDATTWFGLGCDLPLTVARGYHARGKHYLASGPASGQAAYYLAVAPDRQGLIRRLKELSAGVHTECDRLVADYEHRLKARPQIHTGNSVLNSFFMQQPEMIHSMNVHDRPGAVKATLAGYFVWGWDGLTPTIPCALANEPETTAAVLRFWQDVCHPQIGIPLQLTTAFKARLNNAFPAQCQYIAGLYHYVATTGDLGLAKELLPTCELILAHCRKDEVGRTGLVCGPALWPDFPEAMGEDGHDISALNNSLLYQGLRAMEYLYAALGNTRRADECRDWAQRLRAQFVTHLYDEGKGYFISSCSSKNFKPRQHYVSQSVFWITPFARELVSHAPVRIAAFMDEHLRSAKCLRSMPRWDTAWMADGNQLGASYPSADYFYLNVHKLIGDATALDAWLGDVEWFWRRHTVPEAFTPEAENEHAMGADNQGCKQLQACSAWYAGLYVGLAGMDFDHEGITFTPWGARPLDIRGLKLRGTCFDLKITGSGSHLGALRVNGKSIPVGSRKLHWSECNKRSIKLELVRSSQAPPHPEIVRADGLRIEKPKTKKGRLAATIGGDMSGEIVVFCASPPLITLDGRPLDCAYDAHARTLTIPFSEPGTRDLIVHVKG